jgi:prepilin peptidase dependent protein B
MSVKTFVRKQSGSSLVELMVGLAIGLIIVAAAASVYITAVRSGADTLRSAKLNMELRSAMDIMVAEIRRAGYTPNTTNLTNNPFMLTTTNLTLVGTDCLLFAYDTDGNSSADSEDFFGFRRNTSDASISMRRGGASTSGGCTGDSTSWERITDPDNVVIDTLSFSISYQCQNAQTGLKSSIESCTAATGNTVYPAAIAASPIHSDLIEIRDVTITLEGHHKSDALTKISLSQSVRVRNDRIQTVPAP